MSPFPENLLGARFKIVGERQTSRRTAVPILLYHAVTETPGSHIAPFTVSPDTFARQLDVLVEAGYHCVTFGELMAAEATGRPPGPGGKVAVLTFDDGFADFAAAALPALRERSLVSTLYLTTGWLDGVRDRHPGPSDPMLSLTALPVPPGTTTRAGCAMHCTVPERTPSASPGSCSAAPPRSTS